MMRLSHIFNVAISKKNKNPKPERDRMDRRQTVVDRYSPTLMCARKALFGVIRYSKPARFFRLALRQIFDTH
jgi:hypothetical protein